MYKYLFIFTVSFFSFGVASHAMEGSLILEANLSEEQIASMKKIFVEPYIKETQTPLPSKKPKKKASTETSIGFPEKREEDEPRYKTWTAVDPTTLTMSHMKYPLVCALDKMTYTTTLLHKVDEEEAQAISEHYQEQAKNIDGVYIKYILKSLNHDRLGNLAIGVHPETIKNWNGLVAKQLDDNVFENNVRAVGSIYFGRVYADKSSNPTNSLWDTKIDIVKDEILTLQSDNIDLSFKEFNLKHIDDQGNVIFSNPIKLGQAAQ